MPFSNTIQFATFPPDHPNIIIPDKHERVEGPDSVHPLDCVVVEKPGVAASLGSSTPSLISMLLDRGSKPEPAAPGQPPQNLTTHGPLICARSTPVKGEAIGLPSSSMKLDVSSLSIWASVQSLLVQFSSAQVRADLINGKFGGHINPQLLNRIDDLHWTVLPRWQSGILSTPSDRERMVVEHMIKLLSKSEELLLVDSPDKCLAYKEWFMEWHHSLREFGFRHPKLFGGSKS